jgi:CRP-like cAMP-binding protein
MAEVERANSYAGNSLLRNLAPQDLAKLTLHLEPCEVPVHFIFNQPRKEIRDCYFLTRGMASTVAVMQDGSCAVVGVTGSEGLVGFQPLLGIASLAHQTIMQVSGSGFRVETARLRELTGELPGLRHAIGRFIWASLGLLWTMRGLQPPPHNGRETVPLAAHRA